MWEKREDMFQWTDPQMRLSLAKRFSDLTWKSHHHVESFLTDLGELRAAYVSTGIVVSKQDFFTKLLMSLPEEFKMERLIITSWLEPDFDHACWMLLEQQANLLRFKR